MYRIGIDLGGTNIAAGVVNDKFEIIGSAKCKTALPRPAEAIIADMARVAREAAAAAGLDWDQIAGVGVGCPGTCNQENGLVEYSNNLRFDHVPLKAMLEELLGKPVAVDNDANVAALGEAVAGAAKGAAAAVCVTLGTGVGGGIIIDGKIYSGSNYGGAELGHTVVTVGGEECTCGRKGCWEAYASATALISQTRRKMEQYPGSLMWQLTESGRRISGRTAFDAMRAGDPAGTQVVEEYIYYIACGLINIINIFQPEILCIGGGICNEGETLTRPLMKWIEAERYTRYAEKQTRLCIAALGNDAGIIGAAAL
ncbi:MAG: ROK family protein [Oscillospiraceae bacterium]|nr:ROK family protein [Oscillospiraceae bacterium]